MTTSRRRLLTTATAAVGTAGAAAALAPTASAWWWPSHYSTPTHKTLSCTSRYYNWSYRTYCGKGTYGHDKVDLVFGSYCGRKSVFVLCDGATGKPSTTHHKFKDTCRYICIWGCYYRIIECAPKQSEEIDDDVVGTSLPPTVEDEPLTP